MPVLLKFLLLLVVALESFMIHDVFVFPFAAIYPWAMWFSTWTVCWSTHRKCTAREVNLLSLKRNMWLKFVFNFSESKFLPFSVTKSGSESGEDKGRSGSGLMQNAWIRIRSGWFWIRNTDVCVAFVYGIFLGICQYLSYFFLLNNLIISSFRPGPKSHISIPSY